MRRRFGSPILRALFPLFRPLSLTVTDYSSFFVFLVVPLACFHNSDLAVIDQSRPALSPRRRRRQCHGRRGVADGREGLVGRGGLFPFYIGNMFDVRQRRQEQTNLARRGRCDRLVGGGGESRGKVLNLARHLSQCVLHL